MQTRYSASKHTIENNDPSGRYFRLKNIRSGTYRHILEQKKALRHACRVGFFYYLVVNKQITR